MERRKSVDAAMSLLENEGDTFIADSGEGAMRALLQKYGRHSNINPDNDLELIVAPSSVSPDLPGECPHCHRLLMLLIFKDIPFLLRVNSPGVHEAVPWLGALAAQSPPILRHKAHVITNVDDACEYLESTFPDPSMLPDDYDLMDFGCDLFGAFFRYLKNKRPSSDEALKEKLLQQLDVVSDQLNESGGPYIAGENLTLADCNLWPKLNHVVVALAHFKGFQIPDRHITILAYIGTMMQTECCEALRYPDEWVHSRWAKYRA